MSIIITIQVTTLCIAMSPMNGVSHTLQHETAEVFKMAFLLFASSIIAIRESDLADIDT